MSSNPGTGWKGFYAILFQKLNQRKINEKMQGMVHRYYSRERMMIPLRANFERKICLYFAENQTRDFSNDNYFEFDRLAI